MTDITATQALDFSELIEEIITTRNAEQWQTETGEEFVPPRPRPLSEATEAFRAALQGLIEQVAAEPGSGEALAVIAKAPKPETTS